jgi:hypothetical protein
VVLVWSSVGTLLDNEYYVVRIPYDYAGGVAEFWRKGTSMRVPAHFSIWWLGFPDRRYHWSVQVMRCRSNCSKALDLDAQEQGVTGVAVGTRSEGRAFYWYADRYGSKPTPRPTTDPGI